MRKSAVLLTAAATATLATPALAADLNVSVEVPRISGAGYHRPYVAVWIARPGEQQPVVQTLAVWYQQTRNNEGDGKDWLKDMREWWRRGGRATTMPADGVSSATKAPGAHAVRVPGARLRNLPAGDYVLVVEAARELGGREVVRVPFTWGRANTARGTGRTELGAVSLTVTR